MCRATMLASSRFIIARSEWLIRKRKKPKSEITLADLERGQRLPSAFQISERVIKERVIKKSKNLETEEEKKSCTFV